MAFEDRRKLIRCKAESEEPEVACLLMAIAKIPFSRAWYISSTATTIINAEHLDAYNRRLTFGDGSTGELELGQDFWGPYAAASYGFRDIPRISVDTVSNGIVWNAYFLGASRRVPISGEQARALAGARHSISQPVHDRSKAMR
jgi:hypothetical protein